MYSTIGALAFEKGFLELGSEFSTELRPTPLPQPSWVVTSPELAYSIGLDTKFIEDQESLEILTGNLVPQSIQPYASVYSGHQFGVWAGQLGDGRAISLGQITNQDKIWEIQLKGAGPTPYSRMGDGRAVLRSSIREFLCSEAMHHLGIPTTRALAITSSKAPVLRESLETAAVVTRIAPSFIRFGHFEHFAANGLHEQLQILCNHVIKYHYSHLVKSDQPYLHMFQEVLERSARLVAQWQSVGFCHGVLNTDNMSILGLTLDYGPFGFMDKFSMNHICNHTDSQGRYSYANQPSVFYWNLVRLAQAMLPVIADDDSDEAMERAIEQIKPILSSFSEIYQQHYRQLMSKKLGLQGPVEQQSNELIQELIKILDHNRVDYTFFFRNLTKVILQPSNPLLKDLIIDRNAFDQWLQNYLNYLHTFNIPLSKIASQMNQVNPKYILRQHLAQNAIALSQNGDHSLTQALQRCLVHPFDEQPEFEDFAKLPPDWAEHLEVSCSS
jgi:uncharacterized protein YdiU (UPF0061 family)